MTMNLPNPELKEPLTDGLPQITFETNWNKKLYGRFYTSIRLSSSKYIVGNTYAIILKGKFIHRAKVVNIKKCLLSQLPEFTACLDTGYTLNETIELIQKMYKRFNIDWNTKEIVIILFQNLEFE